MGALIAAEKGMRAVWRCHIGLDTHTPATRAAWSFLRPHAVQYNHAIFSTPEYIPDYLAGCSTIIHPALDPLSHKNRELPVHKLVGILCNSHMAIDHHPVVTPFFEKPAMRLQPDGTFQPAVIPDEAGLMYRPIVTQISRWDYLKGFRPLLESFVLMKQRLQKRKDLSERSRRRLEIGGARRALERAGATATGMSGSGPTAYGYFPDRKAADAAVRKLVLPKGAMTMLVSSPGSSSRERGWGVAKG